jgi:hypothetical protein
MLACPQDPEQVEIATAESCGLWRTAAGSRVCFQRLALTLDDAGKDFRLMLA